MRRQIILSALGAVGVLLAGCDRANQGPLAPEGPSVAALAATATQYSGRATVVSATVLGLSPIVICDTGPLPSQGGPPQSCSLLSVSVPNLLTADVVHATTYGRDNVAFSEASVADLALTVGGNSISAGLLFSKAEASCGSGSARTGGVSQIARLVINGQTINVGTAPNQTITLPNGRVVINEQTTGPGSITVTALHVIVNGIADVAISTAHADVVCATTTQASCEFHGDFVTGGGWIDLPGGGRANFAVAGGFKNGTLWGHLEYNDKAGTKVHGTGVTAYTATGPTSRQIDGTWSGGTYRASVADNGEPGQGVDFFGLVLSNGYSRSGNLGGGNIQLHQQPAACN